MRELRCWDWFARRGRGTSLRIPGAVADFRAVVAGTHRLSSRLASDRLRRWRGNEATPLRWRALSSSEFGMWTRENCSTSRIGRFHCEVAGFRRLSKYFDLAEGSVIIQTANGVRHFMHNSTTDILRVCRAWIESVCRAWREAVSVLQPVCAMAIHKIRFLRAKYMASTPSGGRFHLTTATEAVPLIFDRACRAAGGASWAGARALASASTVPPVLRNTKLQ